MNSVRTRLFLNITFLVAFFFLISWGFSTLVLEKYYLWHKKHSIITSGQTIATLYDSNIPGISLELERIANRLGASIVILNHDGYIKYNSFERIINPKMFHPPQTDDFAAMPPAPKPPPLVLITREDVAGNSVLEMGHDQALNVNVMVLKHQLNNADLLIIQVPLAAVAESASYASTFMGLTGFVSILAGCIWAFFFAQKFTRPLLELSNVVQSISQLDFSQKYIPSGNDEVSKLGQNINHLSDQLNKAISELHRQNQQLLADVEKERRLDQLRKNFISSVSHELKTPLALILGYAEGLKENINQDEENKNYYCSVIVDEAEKMDKLVKDLLNLSQIESGFYFLERTVFDLAALLDDILMKYRTMLLEKNITLDIEKVPSIFVNGDRVRIEQVLVNFLNNAIDHAEPPNRIKITIRQTDVKIKVSIYNTGKHIPADSIENLWLSFYKVDKARTRGLGGYGLGLSIVRAIQELHGNSYGVENADGGVTFWFDLDKAT